MFLRKYVGLPYYSARFANDEDGYVVACSCWMISESKNSVSAVE